VFLNPQSTKDRHTILISQTCAPDAKNELERTLIAYRLATALQNLPTSFSHATPFSSEILSSHQQVIRLINSLMGASDTTETDSSGLPSVSALGTDTCDFCDAPIPLTDLNLAACTNGHQFKRCGLSFLAIQAPRITKTCGICDTVFFSEEFVEAQEDASNVRGQERAEDMEMGGKASSRRDGEGGGEFSANSGDKDVDAMDVEEGQEGQANRELDANTGVRQLPVSLARLLFLACDVCIYCGGKFVG
jgi:hypothetical protein